MNLVNQKFDYWTVVEIVKNKFGPTKFLCKCDCGIKRVVMGSRLKKGTSKSCGCATAESKTTALELTGQKFNKLTVIKRVENDKWRATQWLCRCECGRESIVSSDTLRNGRSTSCRWCSNKKKAGKAIFKHGFAPKNKKRKSIYNIWKSMKQRCYDVNHKAWSCLDLKIF